MQLNDVIHGFKVVRIRHNDEIKADLYEMIHEKTKAKTIWLKRDDENKTFSIAFKTTPVDDTGVFHILEHSVLNGSKKYPVKEPFVDLLKGSLQTFLNAMTYPDKTVYPVSSRNDKDFVNLMRIYLDAVFNPLVLENPNVFYQEGWHYEIENKDDKPNYKGVVFNEMKGAFSSPDSIRSRLMMHALFPDTCYGNESGGDPEHITDLTYKQFTDTHRKHYNPSNSYIFLDGDMDIEKILGIIDDEYLSKYDDAGEKIVIEKQNAHISEDVVEDYEISKEDDPTNKAQVAYGYVIGDFDEYEKTVAFNLISSVLCGSNESPLKKAILTNKLGEDIYFDVQDGILQPYVEIDVINTDESKIEEIDKTIRSELEKIVEEGIDRKELEAVLNQREFKAKERDFGGTPKGLVYALSSLDSWLYDGDPLDPLCYDELFNNLRNKFDTRYYEELLEEYILNSKHSGKVVLKPSNTLGEIKAEKERKKLDDIYARWSEEDREELVKINENLRAYQASEDTPEQKATLPALHIEDLKKTPTDYPAEISTYDTNTILNHNDETNGISYVGILLKADDFELEEYTLIQQLLTLIGKIKTKNYSVLDLNRKMRSILGDFSIGFSPVKSYKNNEVKEIISIRYSSLFRNDEEAAELINEILYNTDFSDKQSIRDIVKQNTIALQQGFMTAGHSLALQRAASYTSPMAVVSEYAGGYEAYRFMKQLDENWDEKADEFIKQLESLYRKLFIKERYTLSIASENKTDITKALLDNVPSGTVNKATVKKPLGNRKEGIVVGTNVSFAAKNSMFKDDVKKLGTMYVISNILTYDYLWNNIRVKNGAYGCGFRSNFNKTGSFYSYRDPSPNSSLQIFEDTVDYLRQFCERNQSIENYIVGTTGDFDPLLSTKGAIRMADTEYLMDISYDDKKQVLEEILSTDNNDIEEAIALFEKMNREDNICVVGNKDAIEKCSDKLENIFDLNSK